MSGAAQETRAESHLLRKILKLILCTRRKSREALALRIHSSGRWQRHGEGFPEEMAFLLGLEDKEAGSPQAQEGRLVASWITEQQNRAGEGTRTFICHLGA